MVLTLTPPRECPLLERQPTTRLALSTKCLYSIQEIRSAVSLPSLLLRLLWECQSTMLHMAISTNSTARTRHKEMKRSLSFWRISGPPEVSCALASCPSASVILSFRLHHTSDQSRNGRKRKSRVLLSSSRAPRPPTKAADPIPCRCVSSPVARTPTQHPSEQSAKLQRPDMTTHHPRLTQQPRRLPLGDMRPCGLEIRWKLENNGRRKVDQLSLSLLSHGCH